MSDTKTIAADIRAMKGRERVAALTAYDFAMTKVVDAAGVPLILVGDSVGMVLLGYPDTTHVTMEEMEHHVRAAARAKPRALLAANLPFHSYETVADAVANARRLVAAGAEAVKAEGGRTILPQVRAILAEGIPFLGHLGMLPQRVGEVGGYRIHGRENQERDALLEDAKALADAGAFGVVLELVSAPVAAEITRQIAIPTIGIGSGDACDGEILVITDLLGTSPDYIPKHVKKNWRLAEQMRGGVGMEGDSRRSPQTMKNFSHIDPQGAAQMVDVSAKPGVSREAVARGEILLQPDTVAAIEHNQIAKGNVFATARVAGIMAAKKTGDLIPLCHPLAIQHCAVEFEIPESRDRVVITASAKIIERTGVEMEALTAVSVAALTIYDMCKAVDKTMAITNVVLVSKIKK